MKVHVYRVTTKYIVDVPDGVPQENQLAAALESVDASQVDPQEPECRLIAVVPAGQETVAV